MLVVIANNQLEKFPLELYDKTDILHPVLTEEAIYKFKLLAQNMTDYMCCGEVLGDVVSFTESGIIYEEVVDIPSGYQQRILPPQYGLFLNKQQIDIGILKENQLAIVDTLATILGVV